MTQAPRVRILSTGSEILQGLYPDTNAQAISSLLMDRGFAVMGHGAAPDDKALIEVEIRHAAQRSELLIVTGGLGPTEDDFNRQICATVYGAPLRHDERAEKMLRDRFASRGVPMPERNIVQAELPEGCHPLYNHWGTAPGFVLEPGRGLGALAALPGPPSEWRPMLERALEPGRPLDLLFPSRPRIAVHTMHIAMTPESVLNEALRDLFVPRDGLSLGILAARGLLRLRLAAEGDSTAGRIAKLRDEIVARVGPELIYAEGDGTYSLARTIVESFTADGLTLALAESCTGGWIAHQITDVPGSSAVLQAGWVVYSNEAKVRDLGVPQSVIDAHGAVSAETVMALAANAREKAGVSYALAVSGVAGPGGGTAEKPVGTVWFGVAGAGGTTAMRRSFRGDRESVRQWAVNQGMELLRRTRLGIDPNLYIGGPNPKRMANADP